MRHLVTGTKPHVTFCTTQLIEQHRHRLLPHLSHAEQALLHSYKLPRRNLHFLGGRVLAKYLLSKYSTKASHHPRRSVELIPSHTGSPQLLIKSIKQSSPILSIAHTQRFILSACSEQAAGCDVERIDARFLKVAERYASPQEHQCIREFLCRHRGAISKELLYTCLWTSKEALTKYLSKYSLWKTFAICVLQELEFYPPHNLSFLFRCQEHGPLYVWHLEHARHIFSSVQKEHNPTTYEELTEAKLMLFLKD